jgi:hypothetical protein
MSDKLDKHLEGIDEERRTAIKKMVLGAAFVVPMVSTFAIDGRTLAHAAGSNITTS